MGRGAERGRHARDDFAGWDDEFESRRADVDDDPEPGDDTEGGRTIVIGGAVEDEIPPPRERRTIVIGGHPDGVPVVRNRRPPPTAVERLGTSPDRIVAYAVALGFLLILIAILTTGH